MALGPAMDASRSKMEELFDAGLRHGMDEKAVLLIIERAAKESAKIFVEMIGANKIARQLLGLNFGLYLEQRKEGAKMAAILGLILKHSRTLLSPYTKDRRNLTESEISGIAQQAAADIARELQIPEKWINSIKDALIPGMADPDRLALY